MHNLTVVAIHGTNDGARNTGRPKWWEQHSPFWENVAAKLGQRLEVIEFVWSGENSAFDRSQAAEDLNKRCSSIVGPFAVVAHSHGGNVLDEALSPGSPVKRSITCGSAFITVGTPFFQRQPGAMSIIHYVSSAMLLVVMSLSLVGAAIAIIIFAISNVVSSDQLSFLLFCTILFVIWLMAFLTIGLRNLGPPFRRVLDWLVSVLMRERKAALKTIYHDDDEAILFLRKMQGYRVSLFRPGAMGRALMDSFSATTAIVVTFAVIASFVFQHFILGHLGPGPLALSVMWGLWLPVIVPLLLLFAEAIGWVVGETLSKLVLNPSFSSVGKKIAFGENSSGSLKAVSFSSFHHPTQRLHFSHDCSLAMKTSAETALEKFLAQHRWNLLHEDSSDPAADTLLTWEELIHTSYFDWEEVQELIASELRSLV